MRHYLLTRSAYAPTIDLERNRKRLRITRGVTARSLAAQTTTDWTWLVLIDLADPLLPERMAAFLSSGVQVIFAPAGDIVRDDAHDKPWSTTWAKHIDWSDSTLTTRIDDDDAFAPWVMETYRTKAEEWARFVQRGKRGKRIVLALPYGWRFVNGKVNSRHDPTSQFASLYAPPGDHATVMDINHTSVRRLARMIVASNHRGWLWVRHDETRSPNSRASRSIEPMVDVPAGAFPIDWSALA